MDGVADAENEPVLVEVEAIELPFEESTIVAVAVADGVFAAALSDRRVFVWGTARAAIGGISKHDYFEITFHHRSQSRGDDPQFITLDPTGTHLFVASSSEVLYANISQDLRGYTQGSSRGRHDAIRFSSRLRTIERVRSGRVEAMALPPRPPNSTADTVSLLVAITQQPDSASGQRISELVECVVCVQPSTRSDEAYSCTSTRDSRWRGDTATYEQSRVVTDKTGGTYTPAVRGLSLMPAMAGAEHRVVVLLVLNTAVLWWMGRRLEGMFADGAQALPKVLHVGSVPKGWNVQQSFASNKGVFGWLTPDGVLHGRVVEGDGGPGKGEGVGDEPRVKVEMPPVRLLTTASGPIGASEGADLRSIASSYPCGVAVMEYGMFVLYPTMLQVIVHPPGLRWSAAKGTAAQRRGASPTQLSVGDVARKLLAQPFEESDPPLGISVDHAGQRLYVYTARALYDVHVPNASANTWRHYLEQAVAPDEPRPGPLFDTAISLAGNRTDVVLRVLDGKASWHAAIGEWERAARIWATTPTRAFEDVALRLQREAPRKALLYFLRCRLAMLKRGATSATDQKSAIYALCVWVAAVMLELALTASPEETDDYTEDFKAFVVANRTRLEENPAPLMELVASHGANELMRFLAEVTQDFRRVLSLLVAHRDFEAAVDVLITQCMRAADAELWYAFSPQLVEHCPRKLVEQGWMRAPWLNADRLVPALAQCAAASEVQGGDAALSSSPTSPPASCASRNTAVANEVAITYLRWLVFKRNSESPAVHNLLLSSLCKLPHEAPLVDFLTQSRETCATPLYDPLFALRLARQANKKRACCELYSVMGLPADAVAIALSVDDVELASHLIERAGVEADTTRNLWLLVCRYLMTRKQVKQCIQLLHTDAKRFVRLEDVLPFLSPAVPIHDFKIEVCSALDQYNREIETLRQKMDGATATADDLRADLSELRHRFGFVSATSCCEVCELPTTAKPFVVFPSCRHTFHQSCLLHTAAAHLPRRVAERVHALATAVDSGHDVAAELDELKVPITNGEGLFVTTECILCGVAMIASTTQPFEASEATSAGAASASLSAQLRAFAFGRVGGDDTSWDV